MSEFIERSKHGAMTAAVESHFGTAKKRSMPGDASGKGFEKYGDSQYNNTSIESGWDASDGGGVGYTPPGQAGHHTK